jgi:hypothetical protein
MTETTLAQFKRELDSFVLIVTLNMAVGALAMAFGMQYLLVQILELQAWQVPYVFRIPVAMFFMACLGLGLYWLLSSARILRGVKQVRKEYRARSGPVPDDLLTCWIVRIIAHYRENRPRIRWMVPVSVIGGSAFLLLGISNLLQSLGVTGSGTQAFALVAAAINIPIGCAAIACSLYFRRYSAAWDERIESAARSEGALQCVLERR